MLVLTVVLTVVLMSDTRSVAQPAADPLRRELAGKMAVVDQAIANASPRRQCFT